jgi:23S rRNA (cytidine1920-2'-O)/16S rRNA (cytidine1409-2'-O)-methyltransferase
MGKVRVDLLLLERGLVTSRSWAQRLIMAGQVRVEGQVVAKPSVTVSPDSQLTIDQGPRYVSRGGEKLAAALAYFPVSVAGKICADVGSSTGGFTDCLLQHGASRVYAIDVGKGILDWNLRNHPQVIVLEATNARYLDRLPEVVTLVTIDASFISLKLLLPAVRGWLDQAGGEVIALIKPQFEAGRAAAAKGAGVIRDPAVHRRVLMEVVKKAAELGYGLAGLLRSPLRGPKGNVEFLAYLQFPGQVETSWQNHLERLFQDGEPGS